MATVSEPATLVSDPEEPIAQLLRQLRTSESGLSSRAAARRLVQYGPNELRRHAQAHWWDELVRQFTHPLALLLWAAAGLAWTVSIEPIAIAIVVVIVLNAVFAFFQEMQAEHAVEALAAYLPAHATALRDGVPLQIPAVALVPGDVLVISEGDCVSADARLLDGSLELDLSALTGESLPVLRSAAPPEGFRRPLLEARDLVFSGTTCTEGDARAVVFATGMHTELGRIAALSERVERDESPLEREVRRVAWLIALIALGMGIAFVPLAIIGAGLSFENAVVFAVGLLVGNVPEGLLPVITLALAAGVRDLAARGAVMKRLSGVETLGSTSVICTDKTGTLTENRMRVTQLWTPGDTPAARAAIALGAATCNNAQLDAGDPTEIALVAMAKELGVELPPATRSANRVRQFHFDAGLERMSTIARRDGELWLDCKGAPERVLPLCTTILGPDGEVGLDEEAREEAMGVVESFARDGLRVLAVARRRIERDISERADAERDLCFIGLTAMMDPPRPEVADAVARCRSAGIRIIVVTGDHGLTAAAVARAVGICGDDPVVVTGAEADAMPDAALDHLLNSTPELIFARSSPETKLRIAEALQVERHVIAMTGDGVNDAPALRRADIGIAMGRSGTDVAREASTMVLTDDNFASIVAAVEAGRRVYDNVRKFIFYIFAHATPEVTPFLVFALSGGTVPLPLPVLQLLAFDVGTETLPALALGREPAEPGLMTRPPRQRSDRLIKRGMLIRAWLFVGVICAGLAMAAYFWVLKDGGWHAGADTGAGSPLHHVYQQATTMMFLSLVMGQVGTAFAARTERASLRSVGVFSNRLLLVGIAFELALSAAFIYLPLFHDLLGTASLSARQLLFVAPFPFIVWGADELWRWLVRRKEAS